MKEQLYTIPLNDAVDAKDECPFCFIERSVEQDLIDFVLGSSASYMEADVREMTDKAGFCRAHFQKMFDYGNTLGNAWILKTHYRQMIHEFREQAKNHTPGKLSLKDKLMRPKSDAPVSSFGLWVKKKEESCYVCTQFADTYERYMDTFFYLYKQDDAFREKIRNSKGFCLSHFGDLCDAAELKLKKKKKTEFYNMVLPLMEKNLERVSEDVAWMVEMFDYQNAGADWKNSKDAIQRGMQKLKGGYPADGPYKMKK